MMFVRFTTLLVALLTLTPGDIERAGASTVAADEHQLDHPTKNAGSDYNLGSLVTDGTRNLAENEVFLPIATGPPVTADQIKATAEMVDRFYQKMQGSADTSWQKTITINVNFVIIKSTGGLGMTEGQMNAQMDVLNGAFGPDFEFNLATSQVVTNDRFFTGVADSGPVRNEIATAHKRGGKETFNVYVSDIVAFDAFVSSALGAGTLLDGTFLDYKTVPGGGHIVYSQGKVSH
jgi:hypothetical protein